MINFVEPLAPEICVNLLQRENSIATRHIAKVDARSLSSLQQVEQLWTASVQTLLQSVSETVIEDQTIQLALTYSKLFLTDLLFHQSDSKDEQELHFLLISTSLTCLQLACKVNNSEFEISAPQIVRLLKDVETRTE